MILFILGGVLMLALCIFIHELGHYLFGRMVGIKAEIFSIGYGKGIWKKKVGDTTWQITAIPLGGYVKFYGDEENPEKRKESSKLAQSGGFYNAPPLRRIVPVLGGPLFNLILGFLLFLLLHSLSGPLNPRVTFFEDSEADSPARKAGLKNNDIISSVDGKPVHSFMELVQIVALSNGKTLQFEVERDGKRIQKAVKPDVLPSGVSSIGLRMPGERYLQVNYPTLSSWRWRLAALFGNQEVPSHMQALPYLKDGDIIISVEGTAVSSVTSLQGILGRYHGQTVSIEVRRQLIPWLAPWPKYKKTIEVPTRPEYSLYLTNIIDRKYGLLVNNQQFHSALAEHQRGLNYILVNSRAPVSFQHLANQFSSSKNARLNMGEREYTAKMKSSKIGLIGFRPSTLVYGDYLDSHTSWWASLKASFRDLGNSIMVYPAFFQGLISGRVSFIENAAGPLRIVGAAGLVLESGFQNYLHLFAAISIALFIMNLLPFPVVDGGHIVFFLYEAVVGKPLSLRLRETMHRFGFASLLFLGMWIMYRDFLWIIGL